jgi:hypothetical protein
MLNHYFILYGHLLQHILQSKNVEAIDGKKNQKGETI